MSKYSKDFKEEALKLSDEIGVKKAALQLGLQYYTLADWRKARKYAKKHTVVLTENEANAKICYCALPAKMDTKKLQKTK